MCTADGAIAMFNPIFLFYEAYNLLVEMHDLIHGQILIPQISIVGFPKLRYTIPIWTME